VGKYSSYSNRVAKKQGEHLGQGKGRRSNKTVRGSLLLAAHVLPRLTPSLNSFSRGLLKKFLKKLHLGLGTVLKKRSTFLIYSGTGWWKKAALARGGWERTFNTGAASERQKTQSIWEFWRQKNCNIELKNREWKKKRAFEAGSIDKRGGPLRRGKSRLFKGSHRKSLTGEKKDGRGGAGLLEAKWAPLDRP